MDARLVISDIMEREVASFEPGHALQDIPGWDSLKVVRLVIRLEEIGGRELTEAEMEGLHTVGDVERFLGAA